MGKMRYGKQEHFRFAATDDRALGRAQKEGRNGVESLVARLNLEIEKRRLCGLDAVEERAYLAEAERVLREEEYQSEEFLANEDRVEKFSVTNQRRESGENAGDR